MTDWPGQNTVPPDDLVAHYRRNQVWERTRYFYETWRKTTALIDPPAPFDELDPRLKIALCAVAKMVAEDARDEHGGRLERGPATPGAGSPA
jgi:hypothetical protein